MWPRGIHQRPDLNPNLSLSLMSEGKRRVCDMDISSEHLDQCQDGMVIVAETAIDKATLRGHVISVYSAYPTLYMHSQCHYPRAISIINI